MSEVHTFLEAVSMGDIARVRELLAVEPSLAEARTDGGVSAVLLACYYQEPGIARLVAAQKSELDVFELAVLGEVERLERLLDEDPGQAQAFSNDGYQPLHLAAFFSQPEVSRLLLARGARVFEVARNDMRIQPLHAAAAAGQLVICEMLLEAGADPNARQTRGFMPLHAAGQNGDIELIRLLLAHGAEREAKSKEGKTAYDYAIEKGHQAAAALLAA